MELLPSWRREIWLNCVGSLCFSSCFSKINGSARPWKKRDLQPVRIKKIENPLNFQEASQSNLMNLEIEDYQKTLGNLQTKLAEREKQYKDSQEEIGRQEKRVDDFKAQIGVWWSTLLTLYLVLWVVIAIVGLISNWDTWRSVSWKKLLLLLLISRHCWQSEAAGRGTGE